MESLPLLLSALSTALATLNTYVLKRQSAHIKLIQGRTAVGLHEIDKLIHEKDEALRYVYSLYTTATECHELLSSILSPLYRSAIPLDCSTLHQATVLIDTTIDVTQEPFYTTWNEQTDPQHSFTFYASDHPDVMALVDTMTRLLGWCERKKTNQTAIHALHAGHAGQLHLAVNAFTHFLHTTCDQRVRVPLVVQKGIGRWGMGGGGAGTGTGGVVRKEIVRDYRDSNWVVTNREQYDSSEDGTEDEEDEEGDTAVEEVAEEVVEASGETVDDVNDDTVTPTERPTLTTHLHHWRHWFAPFAPTTPLRAPDPNPRLSTAPDGYARCVRTTGLPLSSLSSLSSPSSSPVAHHLHRHTATNHTYLITAPSLATNVRAHYLHTHTHFSPFVHRTHTLLRTIDHVKRRFHHALDAPALNAAVIRVWMRMVRKRHRRFARRYAGVLRMLAEWCAGEGSDTHHHLYWCSSVVMHHFRKVLRRPTPEMRERFVISKRHLRCHVTPGPHNPPRSLAPELARRVTRVYAPVLFRCGRGCGGWDRRMYEEKAEDGGNIGVGGDDFEAVVQLSEHVGRLVASTKEVIQADIRFREGLMSGGEGRVRMG